MLQKSRRKSAAPSWFFKKIMLSGCLMKIPLVESIFKMFPMAVIVASAAIMLSISWRKWLDTTIDFGRELYIPWMITNGSMLYKDMMYFNGPFSPYVNAFIFHVFGVGLSTIIYFNLMLTAILTMLIYIALKNISSSASALLGCLIFISLFAFNQYLWVGNFNYICPYSHEMLHGMLLSWIVIICLITFVDTGSKITIFGAGIVSGLVFLTKTEFFIAVIASAITAYILRIRLENVSLQQRINSGATFVIGLLIMPTLAWKILSINMTSSKAIIATLGGWWYAFDENISQLPYYRRGMGIDYPVDNLLIVFSATFVYFLLFGVVVYSSLRYEYKLSKIIVLVVSIIMLIIGTLNLKVYFPALDFAKSLPIVMIIYACIIIKYSGAQKKYLGALVVIAFSMALLGKIIINPRIHHYGFALAMPATLLWFVALFDWIPDFIKSRHGKKSWFVMISVVMASVTILWYVSGSTYIYSQKTVLVGNDKDKYWADKRGIAVKLVVKWLEENTDKNETVLTLPEGIIINYLSRRSNSTQIINLMPPEMLMIGEYQILEWIKAAPPDYVVLMHKDTSEYGVKYFGVDYGVKLLNWINNKYSPVYLAGDLPLRDNRFGLLVLKLNKK